MKTIRLFLWNARIKIQRNMAYRADFLVGLFVSLMEASIAPIFQFLLFTNTKGYPGWTLDEILLFQGLVILFMGIRGLLFGTIGIRVALMVWRGEFDRLLSLPYKPIKSIMTAGFDFSRIGVLIVGLYLSIYSIFKLHLSVGIIQVLLVLLGFACGMILYLGFMIFYCGLMVTVTKNNRIEEIINALFGFVSYPAEIFTKTLRTILSTFLPFLVIVYFPSQVLLSRVALQVVPGMCVCVLFFLLSIVFWEYKMRRYTSAGG